MTKRKRTNKLVRLLKSKNFWNKRQLTLAGIKTVRLNSEGCYRAIYKVKNLPIIIKFPLRGFGFTAYEHSATEWRVYTRLKESKDKRIKKLKRYLPTIYYFNEDTGMTVMREYKMLPPDPSYWETPKSNPQYKAKEKASITRSRLSDRLNDLYWGCGDIENDGNVAIDNNGQLKVIDLGCFG